MDHSLFLTLALWIWLVLSASAVLGSAVGVGFVFSDQPLMDEDWYGIAFMLLCFSASTGFLSLSLLIIGQPVVATWVWRILAGAAMCFGVFCWMWTMVTGNQQVNAGGVLSPWRVLSPFGPHVLYVFGSSVLAAVLFVLSILADLGSVSLPPQATPTPRAVEVVHSQITFWHNVTLSILVIGTLMFLFLFVVATQRGIYPAIESHSGGLGGGLGGWQMSPSLSYLIGAVVFGVLFSLFVLREESSPTASVPNPVVKEDTAPKSGEKPERKESNDLDSGASEPPVAMPVPNPTAK